MVRSPELGSCNDSMTVTSELGNSAAFDGYVSCFCIHSEVAFHIIVIVTNAEDIKIRFTGVQSVLFKECFLNLRIPCRYIDIFVPVKFSSFLVLCKGLYLVSARSLFSFLPRALPANSLALLAAWVTGDLVTAE